MAASCRIDIGKFPGSMSDKSGCLSIGKRNQTWLQDLLDTNIGYQGSDRMLFRPSD